MRLFIEIIKIPFENISMCSMYHMYWYSDVCLFDDETKVDAKLVSRKDVNEPEVPVDVRLRQVLP